MKSEPHAPSDQHPHAHHPAHGAHHGHEHFQTGHVHPHEGHHHHGHMHDHAPVVARNDAEPSRLNLLALSGLQRLGLVAPVLVGLILLGLWATQNG